MEAKHWREYKEIKIDTFPYKGKMLDVIGTSVRWLSKQGDDGHGNPEYGLRFFTVQPGGRIPIHNHYYHQTMYILDGEFECYAFDPETDVIKSKEQCGPGMSVFVPSMEPHGMKNIGKEPANFLCCICSIYDEGSGS